MSLFPYLYRDPIFESGLEMPLRMLDQHFGTGLRDEDLLCRRPFVGRYWVRPHRRTEPTEAKQSGTSEMTIDEDKFQVNLDVRHFAPEELSVKTADDCIVVEGKHEERPDEHGFVYRHFVRRYPIPEGVQPEAVTSTLSSDGILSIGAPRAVAEKPNERVVPIQQISAPAAIKQENEQK